MALRGISKSFGPVRALKDVQIDIRPGEVVALMGENGAGKSTLVKIIAGMHAPSGGRILVSGTETAVPDPRAAARAGIAVVHQKLLLFGELTVAKSIFSGHYPRRAGG